MENAWARMPYWNDFHHSQMHAHPHHHAVAQPHQPVSYRHAVAMGSNNSTLQPVSHGHAVQGIGIGAWTRPYLESRYQRSMSYSPYHYHESDMKKTRHNLVEQNRREKKRGLVAQLGDLLPSKIDLSRTNNINTVLEHVLEFLQAQDPSKYKLDDNMRASSHTPSSESDEEAETPSSRDAQEHNEQVEAEKPIPRPAEASPRPAPKPRSFRRRFIAAFEDAPMGIVMGNLDGRVARCNAKYYDIFGLQDCTSPPNIFDFTAPQSKVSADQAFATLVKGHSKSVRFLEHCTRADGVVEEFLTEMSLVHRKGGVPAYVLCFMYEPALVKTEEPVEFARTSSISASVPGLTMASLVGLQEYNIFEDPEMSEISQMLSSPSSDDCEYCVGYESVDSDSVFWSSPSGHPEDALLVDGASGSEA